MEYVVGIAAAVAVGLFATLIGFDKERSFYPVVLIVIATLYLLFAAMAKSTDSLVAVEVGRGSKCPRDLADMRWGYIQFIHDTAIADSVWFLSGDPGIDALGCTHSHASARLPKGFAV